MHAIVVSEFGGPDVLQWTERPDPTPGPDEVVVQVAAADVLWLETMVRRGGGGEYFPSRPPYVPGNGGSGRVVAVGPGIDPAWIGRAVVTRSGIEGGDAELLLAPLGAVVPVPDGVGLADAAAALHDVVTAIRLFEVTEVGPRDALLVVGASGGLGLAGVQLGLARAGSVVALARDATKIARIRDLGVPVVDSADADWPAQVESVLGRRPDVVHDNVGGALGERAFELTADGGRFSGHGTPGGRFASIDTAQAERRGVRASDITALQMPEQETVNQYVVRALEAVADGSVRPVIGQTFPLERAADAHRAIEGRTAFGKTLLLGPALPERERADLGG